MEDKETYEEAYQKKYERVSYLIEAIEEQEERLSEMREDFGDIEWNGWEERNRDEELFYIKEEERELDSLKKQLMEL